MRDQAFDLRNLVLKAAREHASHAGPPPWLIVATGGKGGVGATTLAANLSVALCEQGLRVLLVDADFCRPDVGALLALPELGSVHDVLTSRRDIHEVLQRGPKGLQILPGLWAPGSAADCSEAAQQRLIQQLKTMGRHADLVILDVGAGPHEVARRFGRAADDIVLVTTPDDVAVMDCYAAIKSLLASGDRAALHLLVNHAADPGVVDDVVQRVDRSCRRFLGLSVNYLGSVPSDPVVPAASGHAAPFVVAAPHSPAARAIETLAGSLAALRASRRPPQHDVA